MQWGITLEYAEWIYHGESYTDYSDDEDSLFGKGEGEGEGEGEGRSYDDDLHSMFNNIGQSKWGENWEKSGSRDNVGSEAENLRRLFD